MARNHHTHRRSVTEAEVDWGEVSYLARIGLSASASAWPAGTNANGVIAEAIDALAREVVRLRAEVDALSAR